MKWPWCNQTPTPCCSGKEWIATRVAERYLAARVQPPAGDLGCDLSWWEWSALVADAASYYDVTGTLPKGDPDEIYASLNEPWYRWEEVLRVQHGIGYYDYGRGIEIGAWAVPQFVDCYPLTDWRLNDSTPDITLTRFLATCESTLERPRVSTYLDCSSRIPLSPGTRQVVLSRTRYTRWFLVGDADVIPFFNEPLPPSAVSEQPAVDLPVVNPAPQGEEIKTSQVDPVPPAPGPRSPFIPSPLTEQLVPEVCPAPAPPVSRLLPAAPLATVPVFPPPPPRELEVPPPGAFIREQDDAATVVNGRSVPYIGPWYYDVTDWIKNGANEITMGSVGQLVPGIYRDEVEPTDPVVRVGCTCYRSVGLRNWQRHLSLFQEPQFTVLGLKKVR